jgi:hypothetical protein
MACLPWQAISANAEHYIDRNMLPSEFRLQDPANMAVSEVWSLVSHIQELEKRGRTFSFRLRDEIISSLKGLDNANGGNEAEAMDTVGSVSEAESVDVVSSTDPTLEPQGNVGGKYVHQKFLKPRS